MTYQIINLSILILIRFLFFLPGDNIFGLLGGGHGLDQGAYTALVVVTHVKCHLDRRRTLVRELLSHLTLHWNKDL